MKNLIEQQPQEIKIASEIYKTSAVSYKNDLINNKNKSQLSQKCETSQKKYAIIKAIDVPNERDNNLLENAQKEKKQVSIQQRTKAFKNKLRKEKNSKLQQKSKISNKSSLVEKLPCAFCSQPITFQEMQIHHNSCKQAFTCDKCKDIFPIILKEQHQSICNSQSKIKKQPSYIKYYDKDGQQENIDEQQEEFIRQHPEIDAQILREYWREKKQNKYENQDRQKQQYYDPAYNYQDQQQSDYQIDQPDYYNNSEYQSENSKIMKGLKDQQIQNLITDFYRKGQNKQEDQCSICTKQKQQNQIIIRLPCLHTFHKECLVPWLQVKATCPSCKYNIKSK